MLLKPEGKGISIIELFKISDLSSSNAFWWVKFHIQAKPSRPGERLQFAVWGSRILEFCEQFRGPVFYTSSNCLSTQSHKNEKVYLASPYKDIAAQFLQIPPPTEPLTKKSNFPVHIKGNVTGELLWGPAKTLHTHTGPRYTPGKRSMAMEFSTYS